MGISKIEKKELLVLGAKLAAVGITLGLVISYLINI